MLRFSALPKQLDQRHRPGVRFCARPPRFLDQVPGDRPIHDAEHLHVASALRLPALFRDQGWLLGAGTASILFGLMALAFPGDGVLDRTWLLGAYAILTGLLLVVLAFRIHGWARDRATAVARAAASKLQRQKTASLLERTEQLYRVQWETTAEAICIIDKDGVIRYSNPAVQRVFGYAPAELVGKDIGVKETERSRARNRERFRRPLRKRSPAAGAGDLRGDRAAQRRSEFPAEVSLSHVDLDGERYLAVLYRDITDRKRAEARQAEHTARLQALANASLVIYQQESQEAILQTAADAAHNIIDAHQAVASLTLDDACTQAVKAVALSKHCASTRRAWPGKRRRSPTSRSSCAVPWTAASWCCITSRASRSPAAAAAGSKR